MDIEQMQRSAAEASDFLKALSNPKRLMILCQLLDSEKSVGELSREVDLAQSALSQHLAKLREQRLVTTRRQAQTIYYTLASETVRSVINVLYEAFCTDDVRAPVRDSQR